MQDQLNGGPQVSARPDGSISPLSQWEIGEIFGMFQFQPAAQAGFIDIEPTWIDQNILWLDVPLLEHAGVPRIRVHRLAMPHFQAVFSEIERTGLSNVLLSCGGTFVPRHIVRDISKPFSSHSWGIAIDLNVLWNGYGQQPARAGETGSVWEVVPIFAAHGFAWGGQFSTPDGMHFELARRDV